uniref:Protein LST8 homolog isoform X2 n=1 Tax=Rhizophora mucronata TaxID=61149 RepID=A0A2P2KYI1_RHIMU
MLLAQPPHFFFMMQLHQIQQQDSGLCQLGKTSGCIKGIIRLLFVVHFMMEQSLLLNESPPTPVVYILFHLHVCSQIDLCQDSYIKCHLHSVCA